MQNTKQTQRGAQRRGSSHCVCNLRLGYDGARLTFLNLHHFMVACIVVIVRVRVVLDDKVVNCLERGRTDLGKLQ